MKCFAIMRHAKIKAGRHLVSVGLHNVRGAHTPNADAAAMPVEILIGTSEPHKDVMRELKARGVLDRKLKKDANVAIEVLLAASPDWWASKGWKPGIIATGDLLEVMTEWKLAQLEYLRERFGDLLVSAQFHPDEASPHVQAIVLPIQWRKDGRERGPDAGREAWRLSTEKMIQGPKHLKLLQSEYAKKMARFGLVRGEDRETGTTWHQPLKEWQAEQAENSRILGEAIVKQYEVTRAAEAEAANIRRAALEYAAGVKARVDKEAEEARELATIREEMLRRKEDASSAALKDLARQRDETMAKAVEVEAERKLVGAMRAKLEKMIASVDSVLTSVMEYADKYLNAPSKILRQGFGTRGPASVKIASSEEVQELAAIKTFLGGRGIGGR